MHIIFTGILTFMVTGLIAQSNVVYVQLIAFNEFPLQNMTSNIEWIHPCDVRSIDVLKDGMAAIYGARGANGVVIIETKRGNN